MSDTKQHNAAARTVVIAYKPFRENCIFTYCALFPPKKLVNKLGTKIEGGRENVRLTRRNIYNVFYEFVHAARVHINK